MDNLASLLDESVTTYAHRTAIVLGDRRMSYAELDAAANRVANLLTSRGIGVGDKVALSCPNIPQFTIIYFGILKAGATVVPLNVLLKAREVAYHLDDSEAVAHFAFEGSAELPIGRECKAGFDESGCKEFFLITAAAQAADPELGEVETFGGALADQSGTFETVDVDAEATAVILYTSGTTGQPKGAELRHRNMLANARTCSELFEADRDRPDTYLCVLPLFHSFGQTTIQNNAIGLGSTIVMLPRFDAATAIAVMLQEKVSFFAGVPTMYWALLGAVDENTDTAALAANLRIAVSGGAALPIEIHKNFQEEFGVTILEGYGLSETSPVASFSRLGQQPRVGSIGTPIPGVEMKLISPYSWDEIEDGEGAIGEIAIRGHNVMAGYYRRPAASKEVLHDGWFRTGDLARRDEDGWYYIVDRAKDMIIRNGFNVYPREIEEVLGTHPEVSLVAVIGVPHPQYGEEVKAFVIPAPGSAVTSEELIGWAADQMAAYKYPRTVELVDSLPMTATGKILKRELVAESELARA